MCDRDTVSDDILGERDVDLRKQYFWPNIENGQPTAIEVYRKGKITGTVFMSFSKSPKSPGHARSRPPTDTNTRWVAGQKERPQEVVTYIKKKACEDCFCSFLCCCSCDDDGPVTRAAELVETYPRNFQEVGYRVDVDGRWDTHKYSLEMHHLDLKPGDNFLSVGAHVDGPMQPQPMPVDMYVGPSVQHFMVPQSTMSPQPAAHNSPLPAALQYTAHSYASPQMTNSMSMTQLVYGQPKMQSSPSASQWLSPSRAPGGAFSPQSRGKSLIRG